MLKSYLIPRISQWGITIFIGITVTFIIPRMIPGDPVERTLSSLGSLQTLDPRAVENLKEVLADLYGLGGTQLDQYINFWKRLVRGDLGPSLSSFPTPVTEIIAKGLPWTVGLLTTSTLISWLLGVILGTLAGYSPSSVKWQIIDKVFISIYPIPHYILALILVMIFSYYFPIFPLVGGSSGKPALSWAYISSIFEHSLLPATSLIFLSTAFRFIMAKALTTTVVGSDYVKYAETAGLEKWRIVLFYITRNTMLPQITDLGLSLGSVFGGALIIEIVFSYPGIGYSLYMGVFQADFNLILGITIFSIVGIATAALLVDLSYPLLDPRVRYK
ncbi:ABC transporter permease [Candidatus Poribacteria bacterium]|nr:ABC transporter permease [Candidatus Poribacteria bacterium]